MREAHPGERLSAHHSYEQKVEQARAFRDAVGLPWPVLVDGLAGPVQQTYALLPNPVFLIDADGRIAFRADSSNGPRLRRALESLLSQNGRGVVPDPEDHRMHMLGSTAYGWDALERGGRQSIRDALVGMPPMVADFWLGDKVRPLLDRVARRSRPVPRGVKLAVGAAALGVAALAWRARREGSSRS